MKGVLIKDYEMPENCIECPLRFASVCLIRYESNNRPMYVASTPEEAAAQGKPDWCPLEYCNDDSQYKWIPVSERLPDKAGNYLVTKILFHNSIVISTSHFTTNLHDIAEYDFPLSDYKRCGWYKYDSEYGFYEEADIIAWIPLPEAFKPQESEDKK